MPAGKDEKAMSQQAGGRGAKSKIYLEGNWQTQYTKLALELVLKTPLSIAVITASADVNTATVCSELRHCADETKTRVCFIFGLRQHSCLLASTPVCIHAMLMKMLPLMK